MKMFLMFVTVLAISQVASSAKVELEENSFPQAQQPSPQYQEAVRKLTQVRQALKMTASSMRACEGAPASPNCTFENYCSKFADKAQSFYLYQDKEGHQVPNFQMILSLSFAEACLRKPFPQAAVADPFVYQEQLVSAEKAGGKEALKKNLERYNKELNRTRGIFQDVQKRIIALLEKRRTSENSVEINNMITRIKTVKFSSPKLGDGVYSLSAEGCEAPNAYYQPSRHEITICPQFLNLPDASLFSTMAHELGHSIDPCTSVYSYSKNGKGELEMNTPEFMGGDVSKKNAIAMASIVPERNPMKSVVACLQTPASIGVKVPSQKDLIKAIDKEENDLRNEAAEDDPIAQFAQNKQVGELGDATQAMFDDQRKAVRDNYARYKNCGAFSNNGHMQEAFADWISSQALAEKVSEIPEAERARQYAFESQAAFWSASCDNLKQAATQRLQKAGGPNCSSYEEASKALTQGETTGSSHPETAARINRIIFAKPEIQKALGCKGGATGKDCK